MLNFRQGFLFVLAIFLVAQSYVPNLFIFNETESQLESFQENFLKKEKEAKEGLTNLSKWYQAGEINLHSKDLISEYYSQGISFFVLESGVVQYWSEDASIIDPNLITDSAVLLYSKNAIHYKVVFKEDETTYVALILLKNNYSIENEFLQSNFQLDFKFPSIIDIVPYSTEFPSVSNNNLEPVFYIEVIDDKLNQSKAYFLFILFLLGIFLFFFLLSKRIKIKAAYLLVLAFTLRVLFHYLKPDLFSFLPLFHPKYLAISDFIPSLGDLFLHSLLLFYLSIVWTNRLHKETHKFLVLLSTAVAILLGISSVNLIAISIKSSQINFNLNNLFELDYRTLIALISNMLFVFATALLLRFVSHWWGRKIGESKLAIILSLGSIVYFLFILSYGLSLFYIWFIPLIFFFLYEGKSQKVNLLALLMGFLIYVSAIHALLLNKEIQLKEKDESTILIRKLAEEKDPIAEYLFSDVQQKIMNDDSLSIQIERYWGNKESIDQYIIQTYFTGYWDKYKLAITYCNASDSLYVNQWQATVPCFEYFQDIIRREGDIISANNLFQLKNLAGRVDYISEIPLFKNKGKLFIELNSNLFNENEGYPELLIDRESNNLNLNLNEYSYAVYSNDNLIFKNGNYNYSTKLRVNELSDSSFYRYETALFHHLAYQKDDSTTIVLSKQEVTLLDLLTSIAYLLIFYSLSYLILSGSIENFIFNTRLNFRDFTTKVQLFLISSLLSALFLLGLGTTYYIKQQYKLKNESHIKEKIRSVNIELENKIASEEFLSDGLRKVVELYLVKFSNVFYSDINLYNKKGYLYSSSREELFDKGLKSKRMHPRAFQELVGNQKAEWVQSEKIGELDYLSVYIPLRNYDNDLLGYLNLPYFARQGELEKEISTFLVSTINIYIGIFALALLVSILLANQLSRPLLLIRKQISKLKLGSSIELIDWDSNDEIGALVKEYNRMTIELSESADQLAKSEREGAWREMAKQVAHEIKNPLTPMRLSIQHLQRSLENADNDIKERIDRTSKTLIEQIETLTNIASAFSSFAQLPETIITKLNLVDILKSAVELYSNEIEIVLEYEMNNVDFIVKADKDQLLRLFNNLIKNAFQATDQIENPKIYISIVKGKENFKVSIKDNGVGIEEKQLTRIFEPNFTTKSSGTGLGLAMSKSIIEQMGGTIEVKSEINLGTTFIIELPIA